MGTMTEDCSALLGPIIKAWFARNAWPQSVSEGLARSKGWDCGPWASQISICMSGRLTPKPNFFRGLGQFNQAVAERDFVGVKDRRLMDRLKQGVPVTHPNGVPWTASDFFAAYLGALEAPAELLAPPAPKLTQEMVDQWADQARTGFRQLSLLMMSPPGAVWAEIKTELLAEGVALDDIDWTQEVLCGLTEATVDQAARTMVKYTDFPLIKVLINLQGKYGGETTDLKKFYDWRADLPQPVDTEELYPPEPKPSDQRRMGFDSQSMSSVVLAACCFFPVHSPCVLADTLKVLPFAFEWTTLLGSHSPTHGRHSIP
jgi:hypothetical protein